MTETAPGGTWLCPTPLDRERLVDMNARVAVARRVQGVSLGLAAALTSVYAGWWLLGLVAVAGVVLGGLDRLAATIRRPELVSISSIGLLELVLTAAAATTGGARSPLLAWLAVPIVMLAARFPARVVGVGVVVAAACAMLATAVAAALPSAPLLPWAVVLICWGALLVSLIAATVTLQSAELKSREEAVIDPLTGLANRLALASRFEQAATQASILDAWVSVIMCDLDHFKAVNDTHGHDTGDHVLRAVAYEMRRELRSFDAVYRLGGEEFLILLSGVDPDTAFAIAERVRIAIATHRAAGVAVTISAGLASARGASVDPDTLTRAADQALYAAKHAGRNQTRTFIEPPADSTSGLIPSGTVSNQR